MSKKVISTLNALIAEKGWLEKRLHAVDAKIKKIVERSNKKQNDEANKIVIPCHVVTRISGTAVKHRGTRRWKLANLVR